MSNPLWHCELSFLLQFQIRSGPMPSKASETRISRICECSSDDQCLSLLLRGELVEVVEGNTAFTTGYWYFRLCQAYFRSATQGALSRPFAELSPEERSRAEERLLALPADIGLLSMRELAPRMAELTERHPTLNLLAREALAATMVL